MRRSLHSNISLNENVRDRQLWFSYTVFPDLSRGYPKFGHICNLPIWIFVLMSTISNLLCIIYIHHTLRVIIIIDAPMQCWILLLWIPIRITERHLLEEWTTDELYIPHQWSECYTVILVICVFLQLKYWFHSMQYEGCGHVVLQQIARLIFSICFTLTQWGMEIRNYPVLFDNVCSWTRNVIW